VPATPALPTTARASAAEPQHSSVPTRTAYRRLVAPATRAATIAAGTATMALAFLLPATAPVAVAAPAPAVAAVATAPVVTAPVDLAAVTAPAIAAPSSVAMQSALSKIGAPYRYGAAGPAAFDCSGLVNWAFKNAGVVLPRTSRALSQIGTPVAKADLRPGDLVFFYRPISHVAIYIGDGKIVHASHAGAPVKIANLAGMPFTSARRV
jgi:peptidoglycan DL-endopeptidase CwlO